MATLRKQLNLFSLSIEVKRSGTPSQRESTTLTSWRVAHRAVDLPQPFRLPDVRYSSVDGLRSVTGIELGAVSIAAALKGFGRIDVRSWRNGSIRAKKRSERGRALTAYVVELETYLDAFYAASSLDGGRNPVLALQLALEFVQEAPVCTFAIILSGVELIKPISFHRSA